MVLAVVIPMTVPFAFVQVFLSSLYRDGACRTHQFTGRWHVGSTRVWMRSGASPPDERCGRKSDNNYGVGQRLKEISYVSSASTLRIGSRC